MKPLVRYGYHASVAIAVAFMAWRIAGANAQLRPVSPGVSIPIASETDWNDYLWPIEDCTKRTSDFGEFRDSHFHAGLDISTQLKTGWPVRASRGGWLQSARFEIGGYGLFLVLRHEDGWHTTYAHLSRYAPVVREAYERKLAELGRSFGMVEWRDHEVPITRGDIIAYSGMSGAGSSPHLHFEIRDPEYTAFHPALAPALRTPDTIAPVFHALCFMPLDASSTVDGRHDPLIVPVTSQGAGRYRVDAVPVLTGMVGVSVRATDRAQAASDVGSPASLVLMVNDAAYFSSMLDRIPSALGWHVRIDRENDLWRGGIGEFRKLYREEGNRLPVYTPPDAGAGMFTTHRLTPGRKQCRIVAKDISGNSAELAFSAMLAVRPAFQASLRDASVEIRLHDARSTAAVRILTVGADGRWQELATYRDAMISSLITWTPQGAMPQVLKIVAEDGRGGVSAPWYLHPSPPAASGTLDVMRRIHDDEVIYTMRTQVPFRVPPRITVSQGTQSLTVSAEAGAPTLYRAIVRPLPKESGPITVVIDAMCGAKPAQWTETLGVTLITPSQGGTMTSSDGVFTITFAPGDASRPMLGWVETLGGGRYKVLPQDVPLAGMPRVSFRTTAVIARQSVVRAQHPDIRIRMKAVPRADLPADVVAARCGNYPATYSLLNDTDPPGIVIGSMTGSGAVPVALTDATSGVDWESLVVSLDGRIVIADYQEGAGNCLARVPKGATGTLTVRVRDKAGNERTTSATLAGPAQRGRK